MLLRTAARLACAIGMLILWSPVAAQELALAVNGPRFLYASAERDRPVEVDVARSALLRRRVSLSFERPTVGHILAAISQQTGLEFVYSRETLPVERIVGLRADSITVAAALTEILVDTGLDVLLSPGRQVVLARRADLDKRLETGTIAGRVTDAKTEQGIPNVSVSLAGTQWRAATDANGEYRIADVAAGTYALVVSRIGYAKHNQLVTVAAGEEVTVDFALQPAPTELERVVVTGPAVPTERFKIGNAVGGVQADSTVGKVAVTTVPELIMARVPGVQVLPAEGFTGNSPRIRIRGTNSFTASNDPLIIVDGARVEGSAATRAGFGMFPGRLGDFSPDEIESVEIVKGPSAATLYGTDAANGVILIRTKRGAAGKTTASFFSEVGSVSYHAPWKTNWYAFGHSTTTGAPMQCVLSSVAAGICVQDSLSTLNPLTAPDLSPLDAGLRQEYGVQVSGGAAGMRYFLSGGYESETGGIRLPDAEITRLEQERGGATIPDWQIRPNQLARYNLRANATARLTPNANLDFSAGFVSSSVLLPTFFVSDAYSSRGYRDATDGWQTRPGELFATRSGEDLSRFTGSISPSWQPARWLTLRGTLGGDFASSLLSGLQRQGEGSAFGRAGRRQDARTNTNLYSLDLGASASASPSAVISARTSVGVQYNRRNSVTTTANATGLSPGSETVTGAAVTSSSSSTVQSVVAGAYAEEMVGVRGRLFITGAVRLDGASAFGNNFNAAVYPKASVSWLLSEEPFFRSLGRIASVRLRAAFGASGVQPSALAALQRLEAVSTLVGGQTLSGLRPLANGNPDLRPERQTEFEGGVDLEMREGRLRFEGTYYHRQSADALLTLQNGTTLAPSVGVNEQTINIGEVRNTGFEGLVSARVLDRDRVTADLTFNGSLNHNRLLSLGDVAVSGTGQWRNLPGYPLFGNWGRPVISYADTSGDGILTRDEVQVAATDQFLGPTTPTKQLTAGARIDFRRGLVQLQTLFDYRGGFVEPAYSEMLGCLFYRNCRVVNDRSSPLEAQAQAIGAIGFNIAPYTADASYWQWRELSVSLALDRFVGRVFAGRSLLLTVAGRNLATFTKFPGVVVEGTSNPGTDFGGEGFSPPPARYFIVRVTAGL